jgi:hypothetical protein
MSWGVVIQTLFLLYCILNTWVIATTIDMVLPLQSRFLTSLKIKVNSGYSPKLIRAIQDEHHSQRQHHAQMLCTQ